MTPFGCDTQAVRFVRAPEVAFFKRLDVLDLVGDFRDCAGPNPHYAFIGMVRDQRLSSFATRATLKNAFKRCVEYYTRKAVSASYDST
jgi:hypothetical protein